MAKKSHKKVIVSQFPEFGLPLSLKFLGKPIKVAFTILETAHTSSVFQSNSEDFEFTTLEDDLQLFDSVDDVKTFAGEGKSLGIVFVVDDTAVRYEDAEYFITGEFFPFEEGSHRFWRNPRLGMALTMAAAEDFVFDEGRRIGDLLPNFEEIYFIEQIIDPAGFSDSLHERCADIVKTFLM